MIIYHTVSSFCMLRISDRYCRELHQRYSFEWVDGQQTVFSYLD